MPQLQMLVRDSAGDLFLFGLAGGSFVALNGGKRVGNGFNFTHYVPGEWRIPGHTDLVGRTGTGDLFFYACVNGSFYNGIGGGKRIGYGFGFENYFCGEWAHAETDDLLARDSAGNLRLYIFNRAQLTFNGVGGSGEIVGNGWNFTDYLVGRWDKKDRTGDLVVRGSTGEMRLYPFDFRNNKRTFYNVKDSGRIVGTGFTNGRVFSGPFRANDNGRDQVLFVKSDSYFVFALGKSGLGVVGAGTLDPQVMHDATHVFPGNWSWPGTPLELLVRRPGGTVVAYLAGNSGHTVVATKWNYTHYLPGHWSA